MARTAPFPNIPALPGMNPGIWLMGGGGAGGGAGGDGGDGTGDGTGANGENGGDEAAGDGRGACSTGLGNEGGCPNHHGSDTSPGVSRGDPVDVVTGAVITEPTADVRITAPLPFVFVRRYRSSFIKHDLGLGWGWSHSFAWRIHTRRRTVEIATAGAAPIILDCPADAAAAIGPGGLILARTVTGFTLDVNDGLLRDFAPAAEPDTFRIVAIRDRHRNTIRIVYGDDGHLHELVDAVGRSIQVKTDEQGHIIALRAKNAESQGRWVELVLYAYDERGNLVAATDAEGYITRYAYDDGHRLVETTHPNGVRFHYVYDASGRCVETWGTLPDGDEGYLAPNLEERLADHETKARGIHHCKLDAVGKYIEVVDSVKVQRFSIDGNGRIERIADGAAVYSRTYDEQGMLASFTDPLGATWKYQRDGRGNQLAVIDPLGATTILERDPNGDIRRIVGPLGETTEVTPRPDGLCWTDAIGATFDVRLDERGLVTQTVAPNGAVTRFEYDPHGNLVRQVDPLGASWTMEYDYFGRRVAIKSPTGAITGYDFDGRGKCVAIRRPGGGAHRFAYDSMGVLIASTDEQGRTVRFVRRGMSKLCEIVYPDGAALRLRYDREGRLLLVQNELGESHDFTLGTQGLVTREKFFDGRVVHYRYDLAGRLVGRTDADGELTQFTYDLAGRLVERRHADGSADVLTYDLSGRMVASTSGETEVQLTRNPVGWVTKERVRSGEFNSEVDLEYDAMGNFVAQRSSLGHQAQWRRNVRGWAERTYLLRDEVTFEYDAVGRPVRCMLPAGGIIETGYDSNDRMTWRVLRRPTMRTAVAPGEPMWVGPEQPDVVISQRYQYGPASDLLAFWDSLHGWTQLQYDPRGQLLASIPEHGRRVVFGYDAAGNPYDAGEQAPARRYGSGNLLLERGDDTYVYDACGRLIERRTRAAQGGRTFRLKWLPSGQLGSAEMGDGTRVTFTYDAFARRMCKEVLRPGKNGKAERTSHRYVWSGAKLLHTETRRQGALLERRTYAFDEFRGAPWAERVERNVDNVMVGGCWQFFLADDVGAPERLVSGDGAVIEELAWAASGAAPEATPFRFPGQIHDPETGLSYNRHRYYDPEARRYISPDPLGIYPDPNTYRYAGNDPFNATDPEGLSGSHMTSRIVGFGRIITGQSGQGVPREDDAINEAIRNAVGGRSDLPANRGCAEVNALHQMAQRIREQAREQGEGELSNEDVRSRMREAFRDGATIETTDDQGNRVNPCPRCAQIFRELGIHPENITIDDETPARGGVIGPPNPARRRSDRTPHFPGAWDGAHVHVKGGPSRRGANTNPSSTPPFVGT